MAYCQFVFIVSLAVVYRQILKICKVIYKVYCIYIAFLDFVAAHMEEVNTCFSLVSEMVDNLKAQRHYQFLLQKFSW
jgi:hypothetical protein